MKHNRDPEKQTKRDCKLTKQTLSRVEFDGFIFKAEKPFENVRPQTSNL